MRNHGQFSSAEQARGKFDVKLKWIVLVSLGLFIAYVVILLQTPREAAHFEVPIANVREIEIFHMGRTSHITDRDMITRLMENFNALVLQANSDKGSGFSYRIYLWDKDGQQLGQLVVKTEKNLMGYDIVERSIEMKLMQEAFLSGALDNWSS